MTRGSPLLHHRLHIVILSRRSGAMPKFDIATVTVDVEDEWDMDYFPKH